MPRMNHAGAEGAPGEAFDGDAVDHLAAFQDRDIAGRWLDRGADLVSVGRAYVADPDVVERLRLRLPLVEADPTTFYGGGEAGFLDHPSYRHSA